MRIYTFIMAVFVPIFLNIGINVLIFVHIRSSSRRVQPQIVDAVTNASHTQELKITRREISVLRRMIFIFSMFISGWTPVYLTVIIDYFNILDPIIFRLTVIFAELCLLGIITDLLIYNHKLRQYLLYKIRQLSGQA